MAFQMPQIQDNIGNALANIGQIRQQRTANALADRQVGLAEAAGRRQQQAFDAEQAAAQRAQLVDTTKNVLGALARVPQAQRQAAFAQLATELPPEFAQRMASNPDAFTDQNIALALNRFGTLTPDQIFGDARREAQAKTPGEKIVVVGRDGRPTIQFADRFNQDARYTESAGAGAILGAETTRRGQDVSAAVARRGQDITARGQNMADARAREAASRSPAAGGRQAAALTAAQRAKIDEKLQTVALVRGQLARARAAFDRIRDTVSAGPGGQFVPTADGFAFDAAAKGLGQTIRQLTRTPGEGAMSDYESKLAAAIVPDRGSFEGLTEAKINELEQIINDIEAGYSSMGAPQSGGASGGWSIEPAR